MDDITNRADAVVDTSHTRDVRQRLPRGLVWAPVWMALVVTCVFISVQRAVEVNEYKFLLVKNAVFDTSLGVQAAFEVARTNWATAIFVALVLLLPLLATASFLVVRSTVPQVAKIGIFGAALAISEVVYTFPPLVISPMHKVEMNLVATITGYDPMPTLGLFLTALFSTSFLLACGLACLVSDAGRPDLPLARLVEARGVVRFLLGLVTVWLVVGVVGIGLFHRMLEACVVKESGKLVAQIGAASATFAGAYYSALIGAAFLPTELLLRRTAQQSTAQALGGANQNTTQWLKENGFDLSVVKMLLEIMALFAPLLAGIFQGLAKMP